MALTNHAPDGDARSAYDPGNEERLSLLAAVLATDPQPGLVFSQGGDLLLASTTMGAAFVAEWHAFGASAGWAGARDRARLAGSERVTLPSGAAGELNWLPPGNQRQPDFYLLRLEDQAARRAIEERTGRLAEMAHDLRTPLQALIIAGDKLATQAGAQQGGEEAGLQDLARLALDQIRNLLENTRMDATSVQDEPVEVFDITALVRDMIRMMDPICAQEGNTLLTELPEEPAWHSGPAHLIRIALQNLIANASRFTDHGQVTVRLRIAAGAEGAERLIRIEVEDRGPGLSDAAKAAFLRRPGAGRAPATVSGDGRGYGLGLGIVARAVTRLRGRASADTPAAGRGTLFGIEFPLAIAHSGKEPPPPLPDVSLTGLRVLVVEDNPINLAILLRTLADADATAEGVVSGKDALARLSGNRGAFDLVLLDVTLPDIDGIEVARRLRATDTRGGRTGEDPLLIVGLTAHSDAAVHGACLAAGMDRILVKPSRPSTLRQALWETWGGIAAQRRVLRRTRTGETMLDDDIVQELIDDMGRAAAVSFMEQALEEARGVLAASRNGAEAAELRRHIHSAIGSSGLTGLSGVEFGLRALQAEVKQGPAGSGGAEEILSRAIGRTAAEIAALTAG